MSTFEKLAEARIRAWQERQRDTAAHAASASNAGAQTESLEVQLLGEILQLRGRARTMPDDSARKELEQQAHALEVRLMILLEQSGRPIAARQLAERLAKVDDDE